MPFFAPDVMFLSVLPLTVVMLLSVDFWWNSFCGSFWVIDSYSPLSFFSFGVPSSDALCYFYFFGSGAGSDVFTFYSFVSQFSVFGGKWAHVSDSGGSLPVFGCWEVIV